MLILCYFRSVRSMGCWESQTSSPVFTSLPLYMPTLPIVVVKLTIKSSWTSEVSSMTSRYVSSRRSHLPRSKWYVQKVNTITIASEYYHRPTFARSQTISSTSTTVLISPRCTRTSLWVLNTFLAINMPDDCPPTHRNTVETTRLH